MPNILVITYWNYKEPLVQAYTLPYLRIIKKNINSSSNIYILTLEKENYKNKKKEKDVSEFKWLPYKYYSFGIRAFFQWCFILTALIIRIFSNKIAIIHCMGTPAGMIGYLLSIVTGRKLIIDSYEPHAEAMVENGTWEKNGLSYKILFFFEKLQSHRAYAVVAATESMKNYAREKYKIKLKRFYSKPACINFDTFSLTHSKSEKLLNQYNLTNSIVCLYAGKIGGIYLKEEIFDFIFSCYIYWGNQFKILFLPANASKQQIKFYIEKKNIPKNICIIENIAYSNMPDYIGLADFALNPVKPVPSKRHCTSLKDGEYWAMGLPVVITKDISDDSEIIQKNNIGYVLDALDNNEYIKAIKQIDNLIQQPKKELKIKIRNIAEEYRNFSIAENVYKKLYSNISPL